VLQDSFINIHTAIRQNSPQTIHELCQQTEQEVFTDSYWRADPQKGLFGMFYKNPARLYELKTPDFKLGINFMAHFKVGQETNEDQFVFQNTRGIELFGQLDNKLFFYSTFQENQSNLLNYQQPFIDEYLSYRGYGNYKEYQSSVIEGLSGYDYGYAEAFLAYNLSKHSALTLGHGNHFFGNGIRSLILSDSSPNYFYLKLDVQVWKLHYQTIWAELATLPARFTPNNELLPKKYMAAHYFSFKPRHNIEFGLFESIIFSRENNFELQYLNPVIFYRTIEHQLDSPDNVLLGLNLKWNLYKKLSLYSQVVLDEFNLNQLTSGNKWWGNKQGYQLGLKYFDLAGIKNLDAQIEHNTVRPYTYSHLKGTDDFPNISVSNYSHYGQPLAHPLGANFRETMFRLRYVPLDRLTVAARYAHTVVGRNTDLNYGSEILWPNSSRIADFNIEQNQGAQSVIDLVELNLSYKIFSQAFIDLSLMVRQDNNDELRSYESTYFSTAFRYNLYRKTIDY